MIPGLNISGELICEGIVGDGCGGGRLFAVADKTLFAYDPLTQEKIVLLREIEAAQKVSKKGCIVTIECQNKTINFDLSELRIV